MEDRFGVLVIESDPEIIASLHLEFVEIKDLDLHVVSSCSVVLDRPGNWHPDLIVFSHVAESSTSEFLELFEHYPSAYILCALSSLDEELVDRYVKAGANGILHKADRYVADLSTATKKALIRRMERQAAPMDSLSGSSFFSEEAASLSEQLAGVLQPDETILHYRIVEEIGEGGMGEIYRAEDLKLGRQVAIKVLPSKIARNRKMKQRLAREARAASALNHPNIVTIHTIEETRELSFIVMEYVQGHSLQKIFQGGPVEFSRLLNFGKQIAEALDAAHKIGFIHRDIKPANIMLTANDRIKLLDFGLAKWVSEPLDKPFAETRRSDLTGVGTVLGTVAYMSPEQTRGESLDERSDIFSLGCVLYEAATGKLPFQGLSVLTVMDAIAKATYVPPSHLNNALSESFDHLIGRALAKKKEDRYASASEMANDLKTLLDDSMPIKSRPSGPAASSVQSSEQTAIARPVRVAWIVAAAVICVLGLTFWFAKSTTQRSLKTTAVTSRITSIAVLPLRNLSGKPEEEYFADGLTESLIADLAKIKPLKVISRTSAMHYKDSNKPLPKIAKELKVDAVVEGSVLRAGNRVRITAQLVHAVNDVHLWAENYERPLVDILSLQNEVATAIAKEIQIRALPGEYKRIEKTRSVNTDAYEAFLKGKYHWNKRTKEGLEKSVEYFREAIALEPEYAAAYSALADAWQVMGSMRFVLPQQYLPLTRSAAQKAVELDSTLAEAHTSLAAVAAHEWRWEEAASEYQKAIQLNPNYATAHQWYSILLMSFNRCEEAISEIQKAQDLDPVSLVINLGVGHTLSHCGRYEEAMAQFEKTREIDPNHWALLGAIALVHERSGRFEDAILTYEQAWLNDPRIRNEAVQMKNGLLKAYRSNGATGYWERLLKTERQNQTISKTTEASLLARLGRFDEAFQSLEEAYRQHDSSLFIVTFYPEFQNLRSDPRYSNLLRQMGFASNSSRPAL